MRRGPSYDAYRSRNACRRCNPAHSSRAAVHSGGSEPVVERTKPAELSHNVVPTHHNRGAGLDQMRRGRSYDAYRSRNARRRCNPAHSSRAAVHSAGSEPVVERTKPAELSHNVVPAHHDRGAGLDQMRRGRSYDAYRSRNARRRCNPAHSSRAAVHSAGSEPVVERTF